MASIYMRTFYVFPVYPFPFRGKDVNSFWKIRGVTHSLLDPKNGSVSYV